MAAGSTLPADEIFRLLKRSLMPAEATSDLGPGELQCEFAAPGGYKCQFENEGDPFYTFSGKTYCLFHAPLEATEISAPTRLKKDIDAAKFNQRVIDRIIKLSADNPEYKPKYRPMSSATGRRIAEHLEDHLGTRATLTSFRGTIFPARFSCDALTVVDADFENCIFADKVEFNNCTFTHRVSFWKAKFAKSAIFTRSTFHHLALFENCLFDGNLRFDGAHFDELSLEDSDANMVHICCHSDTSESQIETLNLNGCRFREILCLRNRKIGQLTMKGARFDEAPVLAACKVGDDTVFSSAVFQDTRPESASNYPVLRKLALGTGDLTAAEKFRALGLACQAGDRNRSKFSRMLITAYNWSSQSGTDALRPLGLLISGNLICFLIYLIMAKTMSDNRIIAVSDSGLFLFRQIIHPFDVVGTIKAGKVITATVGVIQSLFTIIFLGLFLQAIYRMVSPKD
jgi:uncharacterized protein YjbI with pentapeptide repeats